MEVAAKAQELREVMLERDQLLCLNPSTALDLANKNLETEGISRGPAGKESAEIKVGKDFFVHNPFLRIMFD